MSKAIQLTRGKVAIVDDKYFDYLNQWKWCADGSQRTYYAVRQIRDGNKRRQRKIWMHHEVFKLANNLESYNGKLDHIDNDGCNNTECNLREASTRENNRNARKSKNCSSKFKGLCWYPSRSKWIVRIRAGELMPNGKLKNIHLGYFTDEVDGALAYDAAAQKYFGEFAKLNFPINAGLLLEVMISE